MAVKELGIALGFKCGAGCGHCVTSSGLHRSDDLSDEEIRLLGHMLNDGHFPLVVFTGGEPLLYVEKINLLQSICPDILRSVHFSIITSGSVAASVCEWEKLLSSIRKIDELVLSYDEFHEKFIPKENIQNLIKACRNLNIAVRGTTVIATPFSYRFVEIFEVNKIPFNVTVLKHCGRAKNIEGLPCPTSHETASGHECTGFNTILYVPQRGFTWCVGNLAWNSKKYDDLIFSRNHSNLFKLDAYQKIKDKYPFLNHDSTKITNKTYCDLCEEYFNV